MYNLLHAGWKDIFTAVACHTVHGPVCDEYVFWGWMPFTFGIAIKETTLVYFLFFWLLHLYSGIASRLLLGELNEGAAHGTLTCAVLSILCTLSYHLSLKLLQLWIKMEKGAELMWKTGHCNQPLNSAREEAFPFSVFLSCFRQFTHEIYLLNVL